MRLGVAVLASVLLGCVGPPPDGAYSCADPYGPARNCNEVCAASGSSCIPNPPDDHASCAGDDRFANPSGTIFIEESLDCSRSTGGRANYRDGCDVPFDVTDPGFPVASVACCCSL